MSSRYVVGWIVGHREWAQLAEKLIAETCSRHGIEPGKLTLHADRGSTMASKVVAFLLADLCETKTHLRRHVSNDNPYSEAQFKTMRYRPEFPDRFGEIEDSRSFCVPFSDWYNNDHHHAGLCWFTPADVHCGRFEQKAAERQAVMDAAFAQHAERYPNG